MSTQIGQIGQVGQSGQVRRRLQDFHAAAVGGRCGSMLTCYDATTAGWLSAAGVQALLMGDSAAQVVFGHDNTLSMGMDLTVALCAGVRRGAPGAWLVGDMPFLSYQVCVEDAIRNAGRLLVEGMADTVKLELGAGQLGLVSALSEAGIPAIAHLGLLPQHVKLLGGYRVAGRGRAGAAAVVAQAREAVDRGAVGVLLEAVPAEVGAAVRDAVGEKALVIGCGAGPHVHMQVLVLQDAVGLTQGAVPRFAGRFGSVGEQLAEAAERYRLAVEEGRFPGVEHCYGAGEPAAAARPGGGGRGTRKKT